MEAAVQEIRNPNIEIRSKFRSTKSKMARRMRFRISKFVLVSDFEFRTFTTSNRIQRSASQMAFQQQPHFAHFAGVFGAFHLGNVHTQRAVVMHHRQLGNQPAVFHFALTDSHLKFVF